MKWIIKWIRLFFSFCCYYNYNSPSGSNFNNLKFSVSRNRNPFETSVKLNVQTLVIPNKYIFDILKFSRSLSVPLSIYKIYVYNNRKKKTIVLSTSEIFVIRNNLFCLWKHNNYKCMNENYMARVCRFKRIAHTGDFKVLIFWIRKQRLCSKNDSLATLMVCYN